MLTGFLLRVWGIHMLKIIIDKYFNAKIRDDVRIFNLVNLMGAVFGFASLLVAFLVRLEAVFIVSSFVISVTCAYVLVNSAEITFDKNIMIKFIICHMLCFPLALMTSKINYAEIPVYFLIGVTEELALLRGRKRYLFTGLQVMVDILTMIYAFYFRIPYEKYYASLSMMHYVRLEFAILTAGVICGGIIIYRNYLINEEIQMREKLSKEAEQVSYAKDMFLVNVSHEIRTPLNAIIGTTEVLLDSNASNRVKEMAFNISNSSHALLSITSDLLDFSRINIDELRVDSQKYDIAMMMNDVINLINVRLLDSNIEFLVDVNPKLPKVLIGDSGKIRQILVNLLTNAIKYTKEGHVVFKVDFKNEGDGLIHLYVDVKDTGIGIRADMIDKIFVPYNRSGNASTDHAIEGNGLGLAFCKHLTSAMGGNLWAESTYGKGSTFHFDVVQKVDNPYYEGYCGELTFNDNKVSFLHDNRADMMEMATILDSMDVQNVGYDNDEDFLNSIKNNDFNFYLIDSSSYERIKRSMISVVSDWTKIVIVSSCNYSYSGEPFEFVLTKPVSSLNLSDMLNNNLGYMVRKKNFEGDFTLPNATILIIDDNLVNLDVAGNMLTKYHSRVLKAASGREGINYLQSEKIDLVYLDYMMPDMDGIDTLKEIRKLPDGIGDVHVIALTANVVSGAREMFMNAGFNDYLSKPIESDKLEKTLIEHIPGQYIMYAMNFGDSYDFT